MAQIFGIQEIQISEKKVHSPSLSISCLFPLTGQLPIFHLDSFTALQTWYYQFLLRLNRGFICLYKILILTLVLEGRVFIIG